jgi:hypothetical protein
MPKKSEPVRRACRPAQMGSSQRSDDEVLVMTPRLREIQHLGGTEDLFGTTGTAAIIISVGLAFHGFVAAQIRQKPGLSSEVIPRSTASITRSGVIEAASACAPASRYPKITARALLAQLIDR